MKTGLLADCGGAISRAAIVFPPWYLDADHKPQRAAIGGAVSGFFSGTTLTLLTERQAASAVQRWMEGLKLACTARVAATAPEGALRSHGGLWAQDSFLCTADHRYLVPRTGSQVSHAHLLAAEDNTPVALLDIVLEGGDSLVGPDFRLVGATSVTRTMEHLRVGEAEAVAALAALDPRPLHVVGYTSPEITGGAPSGKRHQPWFHIDLMVSVTGIARAGKPVLLVADARETADPTGIRHTAHAPRLDATVHRLEAGGFHVIRNPVPVLTPPPGHQGGAGGRTPRAYNNVLVQNDPVTVWLPQFADLEPELAAADAANRAIWEGLGFTVLPVSGWSALAGPGGALRCATKVLERG